ncbi:MAG: hypothetical protein ACOC33_01350 [bacterium]
MSLIRTYFEKNNTIVSNLSINTSQNPVTEIFYGGDDRTHSRFLFKIDIDSLKQKISGYSSSQIVSHRLNLVNTINFRPDLIGSNFPNNINQRASSVGMMLLPITESWDEGSGHDFVYTTGGTILATDNITINNSASNWFNRTTGTEWDIYGVYSGSNVESSAITTISFDSGDENIDIDLTDFINDLVYSGSSDHEGFILGYLPIYESARTTTKRGIAFHTKYTNTIFQPFLETIVDDVILDDRKFFYLNFNNRLYFYSFSAKNGEFEDVIVDNVEIYDNKNNLIEVIEQSAVTKVKRGIFYITLNLDSDEHIDSVNYKDIWNYIDSNNKTKQQKNKFYLLSDELITNYNRLRSLNPGYYNFGFSGIRDGGKYKRGEKLNIIIYTDTLYINPQDITTPINLSYRVYVKQGEFEIDIIPTSKANRNISTHEILIDTSWMIEQQYYLELTQNVNGVTHIKDGITFYIK